MTETNFTKFHFPSIPYMDNVCKGEPNVWFKESRNRHGSGPDAPWLNPDKPQNTQYLAMWDGTHYNVRYIGPDTGNLYAARNRCLEGCLGLIEDAVTGFDLAIISITERHS